MRDLCRRYRDRRPVAHMLQEVPRRHAPRHGGRTGPVVAEAARRARRRLGRLYVIDYEQRLLVPAPGPAPGRRALRSTAPSRAARSATSSSSTYEADGGRRLWLPAARRDRAPRRVEAGFPDQAEPLPRRSSRRSSACAPRRDVDRRQGRLQRLLRAPAASPVDDDGERAAVGARPRSSSRATTSWSRRCSSRATTPAATRSTTRQRTRAALRGPRRDGPRLTAAGMSAFAPVGVPPPAPRRRWARGRLAGSTRRSSSSSRRRPLVTAVPRASSSSIRDGCRG